MDEIKKLITDINVAFNEYKTKNDERLAKIEKGSDGGEEEVALERLEARIGDLEAKRGELEAKLTRQQKPVEDPQKEAVKLHKSAFVRYLRKGATAELEALRDNPEIKAMSTVIGEDGGYAVPTEMGRTIYDLLRETTPMRSVCNVVAVGTEDYSQLVNKGGSEGGWVGEESARPASGTSKLATIKPIFGEVYAYPHATQRALDDVFFDIEGYILDEVNVTFTEKENKAFTSGDGQDKPKGLFAYDFVATKDATRAYGKFQYKISGAASALGAAPGDNLIDLITEMRAGYLNGAHWMFNNTTLGALRKVKDSDGNYIWRPGLENNVPNMLLGYPYVLNCEMPDIEANSMPIAFGNFKRAYTIVDRVGIRVVRDELTNKPFVGFYVTKRVGGMVVDTLAVKALKISAS